MQLFYFSISKSKKDFFQNYLQLYYINSIVFYPHLSVRTLLRGHKIHNFGWVLYGLSQYPSFLYLLLSKQKKTAECITYR